MKFTTIIKSKYFDFLIGLISHKKLIHLELIYLFLFMVNEIDNNKPKVIVNEEKQKYLAPP
jgi:hypothetical protein